LSRNATRPGASSFKGGCRDCFVVTTDLRRPSPRMLVARTARCDGMGRRAQIERPPAAFGKRVAVARPPPRAAFPRYPALAANHIDRKSVVYGKRVFVLLY